MMLLTTETVVALRCPMCGKFEQHKLSMFAFAGRQTVQISCSCGATKLSLGTKDLRKFWLQVPCVLCETKHMYFYTRKQLWGTGVQTIICSDSRIELGFVGAKDRVAQLVESYEQDISALLEEMDPDDYISNPEIMMEVLNTLHDIAEDGYLYCECGNVKIDVDIMPDRLELHCSECGAVGTVPADTDEDVLAIKNVDYIELTREGFNRGSKPKPFSEKEFSKGAARKKRSKQHR